MLYYKSIPRKFSYSPIFYFQIFKEQNIASSSCEFWYFAAASLYSWEASGNRYRDKERVLLLKYWMSLPNDLRQCYAWSIFYANAAAELDKAVSFNWWSQYQCFIVQKNIFRRAVTGNLFFGRNCNISKIMMFTSPRYSLFRSYHIICLVW